jgi:tetratricopeptide (TPR) repeat protein
VTLRLGEVLAQRLGRAAEAGLLLGKLPVDRLSPDENRLRQIVLADAALVRGELEVARRAYAALSPSGDARDNVRRRARLEGAQSLLARGELDEAERTLTQAVWQEPLEKLNLETGMALLKLALARQEHAAARQQCLALLSVATAENDRAQLLYHLAETEYALGRQDAGKAAWQKLVKEHPYTEAAARAKDKWPGK